MQCRGHAADSDVATPRRSAGCTDCSNSRFTNKVSDRAPMVGVLPEPTSMVLRGARLQRRSYGTLNTKSGQMVGLHAEGGRP